MGPPKNPALAMYSIFSLLQYLGGLVVALALFLFKATETKEWLRKALSKFSS